LLFHNFFSFIFRKSKDYKTGHLSHKGLPQKNDNPYAFSKPISAYAFVLGKKTNQLIFNQSQ